MCAAGHNLRLTLAKPRLLCARVGFDLHALLATLTPTAIQLQPATN
jgi:hypothetical protein